MGIYNEAIHKIERGQLGLNTGLPMGFNRLMQYLPGIQQGTYYLIGKRKKFITYFGYYD